jgi:hypothetical protein
MERIRLAERRMGVSFDFAGGNSVGKQKRPSEDGRFQMVDWREDYAAN